MSTLTCLGGRDAHETFLPFARALSYPSPLDTLYLSVHQSTWTQITYSTRKVI